LIVLELMRLERLHAAVWPQAIRGDVNAVDRVLRIMERRARLLGLDAPKRVAMSGDVVLRGPSRRWSNASDSIRERSWRKPRNS
jgi:hypothetical protein